MSDHKEAFGSDMFKNGNQLLTQWGEKAKKRGETAKKKKKASEVSRAVDWGSGKGGGAWRHAFDAAVP